MTRLEPYVPSLHRDAGKDRYSVGLLLHDAGGEGRRYLELARDRTAAALTQAQLVAVDGSRVWVRTPDLMLVDLASDRIVGSDALNRDPTLAPPERRITPADLAAGDAAVTRMLAAGGVRDGSRWMGVHGAADLRASFRQGVSAPAAASFARSHEPRRLYTASVQSVGGRPRLGELQPTGPDSLFNGAFVRTERDGAMLALAGGGWLMLHETRRYRTGTVIASRVDATGAIEWSVDTGIGQLLDLLPDADWTALVGERPRVPGKLPEPILVTIESHSGRLLTRSLWMR